jgi:uncharacterized SAM-binding protein YcdF (DUF218 family)
MMEDEQVPFSSRFGRWLGEKISCRSLALLGVVVGLVLIYFILVGVGGFLIVSDPSEGPVDAVVILSGGEGDRLSVAVEMLENGLTHNLVITDADRGANARLREKAINEGFDRLNIFITEAHVDSTYEEAIAVRDITLAQGWERLMIVTDPYHSYRTRLIFHRELESSDIEVFVRPVTGHWFRSTSWFFQKEGWQFVFLEIAKMMNYIFVGVE